MLDIVPGTRRGFTLLELVFATTVLALALIPIVSSLQHLTFGFRKTFEATHAAFLAQAIMEGVRYRLYNEDARFYKLNDSEATRQDRASARKYEDYFQQLAEERSPIATKEQDRACAYFRQFQNLKQMPGLHGITPQSNPELYKALDRYEAAVQIWLRDATGFLDSDPTHDRNEVDMAEVQVTVFWQDVHGKPRQLDYWSAFTRYQYEPYLSPEGTR